MNWNTIYITGNDNFWDDVIKKLSHSDIRYLPGFIEKQDEKFLGLIWIDNQVDLREFKEAITAKLIWKYRLQFFNEIEKTKPLEGNPLQTSILSEKEHTLLKAMRSA